MSTNQPSGASAPYHSGGPAEQPDPAQLRSAGPAKHIRHVEQAKQLLGAAARSVGAAIGSRRPPLIWLPAAIFAVLLICGLGALAAARSGAPPEPIITHSAARAALPAAADAPTRVDLNYAARAELEALPAIGPAAAAAIIERRSIAPIGSLRELVELGILRASQLPALADLVMLSVRGAAP